MAIKFDGLFPDECIAFDMYFASIYSMQTHPGAGTRDHVKLTLEECRDEAMKMIKLRRHIPINLGEEICHGELQPQ